MKIFIQGRKDGYNVLYPNPTPDEFYKFAYDIQRIDAQNDVRLYGQSFYSLAFTIQGVIFSKYIIGYDDQRSNLGYIGISVFIPVQKKFSGIDIKNLLDDLVNIYYKNYCPDFNIRNKQEDWILFNSLAESYNIKLKNNIDSENIISGSIDAAFVYFNETKKIEDYFDAPYQEKYQPYRQVLFINKELEGKPENPLNALRNSNVDLTREIDLENPKYKLIFNSNTSNGVRITVKANGATKSNNNKFRRKDELEISWTKQYCKTEIQRGKCFELTDKFKNIDKEAGIVTIKEIELEPDEKTITFEIKDRDGNQINDAEIQIGTQPWQSIEKTNKCLTFKGENIGKSWTFTVRKGTDLISEPHRIDFEKDCVGNVELILQPIKKVTVFAVEAQNEANNITDIKIWLSNKSFLDGSEIVFRGDEIEKKWIIKVSHNDYEEETITDYYPSTGKNPLYVTLRKKSKQIAHLNSNNKGNEINENKKGQRKKQFYKKPAFITASIVLVLAIILGVWIFIPNDNPEPLQVEVKYDSIYNYLHGNKFLKDSLIKYKYAWEEQFDNQQEELEEEKSTFIETIKGFFGGKKEQESSYVQSILPEGVNYETVLQKIDSAIDLRDSINELNFEYLKRYNYSEEQKDFKKAIQSVNSKDYDFVKKEINPVEMTLFDIANSINNILKTKKTEQSPTTEKVVQKIGK